MIVDGWMLVMAIVGHLAVFVAIVALLMLFVSEWRDDRRPSRVRGWVQRDPSDGQVDELAVRRARSGS